MGHLVGKDVYRRLGAKIDGLSLRAPPTDALRAILSDLYSEDEADLVVRMPYGLSPLARLERVTGVAPARLRALLEGLSARGLVLDVQLGLDTWYAPSPIVVGLFEFTMMRTSAPLDDQRRWARLFHDYLEEGRFLEANFGGGERVSVMRSVPHEGTLADCVEVLDHEKARAIVESADRFAMGPCSCRHERDHLGENRCHAPRGNCSSFGRAAAYLVRHGFAREVSKEEMLENLDRSRTLGLVLNADNVQREVTFICHCCSCCCHVLRGISRHGYANAVVTSSYVARTDEARCMGCGRCSRRCPIGAIARVPDPDPRFRKFGRPQVDEGLCLGCGVCAVTCNFAAMRLHPRKQRVLHPETTFERIILQCLERGTLQNQLFDDPSSVSQAFLRAVVGAFLRLDPVKRALMSDALRSRFLRALRDAAARTAPAELRAELQAGGPAPTPRPRA